MIKALSETDYGFAVGRVRELLGEKRPLDGYKKCR